VIEINLRIVRIQKLITLHRKVRLKNKNTILISNIFALCGGVLIVSLHCSISLIYAELVTHSRKVVSLVIGRSRKYRHTPRVPHLEVQQVHTRGEGKDGKLRMAPKQPSQSYYTTSLGF